MSILGDVKIFKGCLLKKGCQILRMSIFLGWLFNLGDVKKRDGSFKNRDVNFFYKKGMSIFNTPISI